MPQCAKPDLCYTCAEPDSFDTDALFKALADPTRLRIISLLTQCNHCVRSLACELGITESAVSQHMTVLKSSGLVGCWRHGHHMHYYVNKGALQALGNQITAWDKQCDCTEDCHRQTSHHFRACETCSANKCGKAAE